MPKSEITMESRMYKKNVSTLGKIKCSQKSVYSCTLPFMFPGLWNTCRFGPLTLFALLLRLRKREKEREREETSTTFRSISGFALPSVIHNNLPPPPCAVLLVESYWRICTGKKRRAERRPNDVANYSKDQIQQNITIPMRFTRKAWLFKSSAPQLFTMISKFSARL